MLNVTKTEYYNLKASQPCSYILSRQMALVSTFLACAN